MGGAPLGTTMSLSPETLNRISFESLERIAARDRGHYRKLLLLNVLEAFLNMNEQQQREYQELMYREQYREAREFMQATFDRGLEMGYEQGQRDLIAELLRDRFGPVVGDVTRHLEALASDELVALGRRLLRATSLDELGLAPTESR
jgi:hypothetical protein